jgi:hypothetical protein
VSIFYKGTIPDAPLTPTPDEIDQYGFRVPPFSVEQSDNPSTPFVPTTPDSNWWDTYPTVKNGGNPGDSIDYFSYQRKNDPTYEFLTNFWSNKEMELTKGFIPGNKNGHDAPIVYSGVDMVPYLSIPGREPFEFGDIQTLSISTHSENFPARILGRRNPLGFSRGPRTIAGSIIFSMLDMYPWYKMIEAQKPLWKRGSTFPLADALPPFDITITMSNEYEVMGAKLIIFGIVIVDDGVVLSIDDLVTENTYSFMAAGIAPIHRSRNWYVDPRQPGE